MLKKFFKNDAGATLVEYALIIALVAIVALGAIQILGKNASTTLSNAANNIAPVSGGGH